MVACSRCNMSVQRTEWHNQCKSDVTCLHSSFTIYCFCAHLMPAQENSHIALLGHHTADCVPEQEAFRLWVSNTSKERIKLMQKHILDNLSCPSKAAYRPPRSTCNLQFAKMKYQSTNPLDHLATLQTSLPNFPPANNIADTLLP